MSKRASVENIMRFVLWAESMAPRFPTADQIQRNFDMSRATAYRWRHKYADAKGIVAPKNFVVPD